MAVNGSARNDQEPPPQALKSRLSRSKMFSMAIGLMAILVLIHMVLAKSWLSLSASKESERGASQDSTMVNSTSSTSAIKANTPRQRCRMFDIILLHNELDFLEIRLNELDSVVDIFVIIEAETTFTDKPKHLHYKLNQDRFAAFQHKIVHIINTPATLADRERLVGMGLHMWQHEHHARDHGLFLALQTLQPLEGDWILLSDLDELPRVNALQQFKDHDRLPESERTPIDLFWTDGHPSSPGDLFRFECRYHYGSFEYRSRDIRFVGPVLVRYRTPDSPSFSQPATHPHAVLMTKIVDQNWRYAGSEIRNARGNGMVHILADACWHCSWCFSHLSMVIDKIESYSHTENNRPEFKDPHWIVDRLRKGRNLFNSTTEIFLSDAYMWENMPEYIMANKERFSYMLDRKGKANAGFLDVDPNGLE